MDTDDNETTFDVDTVNVRDWCLFQYIFDDRVYYVGQVLEVNHASEKVRQLSSL